MKGIWNLLGMDPPETGSTSLVELFVPKHMADEASVKMRVLVYIK
jgi:hypothetical protein